MTELNGSNGVNESKENQKVNQIDLKSKFIKEFTKSFLAGSDRNRFIDDVMNKDSIEDSDLLKKKIKAFKAYSDDNDIKNFDESKISIFDLKRGVGKEYISLRNCRQNYIESTLLDFGLTDVERKKLEKEVSNKSVKELEDLINSEIKNKKELKRILKKDYIKTSTDFLNLLNLSDTEKQARFNNLNEQEKKVIKEVSEYAYAGNITTSLIQDLFNTSYLEEVEKRDFLKRYIPYLSLKELKDIGLLSQSEAELKRKEILEPLLSSGDLIVDDIHREELVKNTSLSDIKVSTKDFLTTKENLDKIVNEVGFSAFENEVKSLKDEMNENIKASGPQNLNELLEGLKSINKESRFDNLEKFKEGNILRITDKNTDGTDKISYIRIKKTDDEDKKLTFIIIGGNVNEKNEEVINTKLFTGQEIEKFYLDFFKQLEKTQTKIECLDNDDVKARLEDPNYGLKESGLSTYDFDDLSDSETKEKIVNKYKDNLNKQLEELNAELESKGGKPEENPSLVARKENIKKQLEDLDEVKGKDLLDFINLQKLIEKLDEFDIDGKGLGLDKGLILETDKWSYEIVGVDDNEVNLKSASGPESFDFESFYQAFKKNKTKRIEKINDFPELITSFGQDSDNKEYWENNEFKDGKLIAKNVQDGDKKEDKEVKFFVSDKNDDVLKVSSISGDTVIVQSGERKNTDQIDKKDKKYDKDGKGEVLYIDDNRYTLTLNEFKKYLIDNNLHPNWKTGKTVKTQSPDDLHNNFKGKFFTKLFSDHFSLAEAIAGGKMFLESIQETLKKGNDLHAAKVALAMGKLLPEEIRADLQIKVERAESEEMDKALEGLGKVDSWIAVKRIEKWLLNKNTPEYKKEAGLLFMLEKYGHLTSKTALYPYRGKFLWYEAFGGRINDDLFLSIKKEAEKDNITFTEEYLLHILLKKQCKASGFAGHKRRSRLHKEYEHKWKSGISDEVKKGYDDADKKRTAASMVKSGIEEATGGTTSNAIGWFKKAVERGGSMEEMNEGFFCLLYSGALYDLDQATFLKLKELWDGDGMPVIMAGMSTNVSDMKLFNRTVKALSKRIGEEYPEYSSIYSDAEKIFDNAHTKRDRVDEKKRLDEAQNFWKKYGKPLSRSLNMNHHKEVDTAKTDKIIFLEKEKNEDFRDYYKAVKTKATGSKFGKGFMEDDIGSLGIGGLNVYESSKEYLEIVTGGGLKHEKAGSTLWHNIVLDIEATRKRIDAGMDREDAKRYIMQVLKEFSSAILDRQGTKSDIIQSINKPTSKMGGNLNDWGFNLYNDLGQYNSDTILKTNKVDYVFSRVAENILTGGLGNSEENGYNPFADVIDSTKGKANKRIDSNDDNDEYLI